MDLMHACILAVIQGITEFLPISSSGHLILIPEFFSWTDQGVSFDIALHFGSLIAILCYFKPMLTTHWHALNGNSPDRDKTLSLLRNLIVATLPACFVGFFLHDKVDLYLRSPLVIATTSIVFGLLLGWADSQPKVGKTLEITLKQALLLGCFQALALIPGTSRSGVTITAGLLLGLSRQRAAEFSFLMAIPIIGLAFCYEILRGFKTEFSNIDLTATVVAVVVTAITSYLTMLLLFNWLRKWRFTAFVIYRVLLGIGLFIFFWQ
jgi:undecaprenyl-diphosphatase